MLTREMATDIVQETMKLLGRNINIMDKEGIILSSGDNSRIDTFHEAAVKVIETGETVVIRVEDEVQWKGVKAGVNLPIKFQNEVIGVVGISGAPAEVEELGTIVVMMTELMIQKIYYMNQVEWKLRTREFLLEEILSENPPLQSIKQKCQLLNVTLARPYEIFVIQVSHLKRNLLLREIYEELSTVLKGTHCLYGFIGTETLVVIYMGNSTGHHEKNYTKLKNMLAKLYKQVRVGISRQVDDLQDVYHSFKDIETAMKLCQDEFVQMRKFEAELLLHYTNPQERVFFKERIIQSLPKMFQETMETFFENDLNMSKTAKKLYIHRNTLIYRLNQIYEITGYDPRNFNDAVTLQLASWCAKSAQKFK